MKQFKYWLNSEKWHGELLAEIKAESIIEADKQFDDLQLKSLDHKGKVIIITHKLTFVSCQIEEIK